MNSSASRVTCGVALVLSLLGTATAAPRIEHGALDALLRTHVRDGAVDYAALQRDEAKLDAYLATLATVSLAGASRAQKLALYINAYNAFTLKLILRHWGRIKSIREIDEPWKQRAWTLAGETLSLDEIEHTKMRRDIGDPRIHFAIVCASKGCPALWDRAYSAAGIDAELDAAAQRFIRSRAHVRFERREGARPVLHLSQIFTWFAGDFTKGESKSVPAFVARYADEETAAAIRAAGDRLERASIDYDWSLNAR